MKDYYQTLGLPPNASPRKIKEQYRKLVKIYHPDRLIDPGDKARSAQKFREITEAYDALSAVVRRANLDPGERKLDFLYQQAKKFFDQNKWSKAMVIFNEILTIDAGYRDVLTRVQETRRRYKQLAAQYTEADTFFKQRNWVEAMHAFELILKEDPHYRDASKKFKKARREQLRSDFLNKY